MQCPKCNSIVLAGSKQCLYCHADLSVVTNPLDQNSSDPRGLRSKFSTSSGRRQPQSPSSQSSQSTSAQMISQAQANNLIQGAQKQAEDHSYQQSPLEIFLSRSDRLEGKFDLAEEIGRGGMGFVYRGMDVSLNREIAVKILPPHYNNDDSVVGRFRREARAMASLDHPNIVTVYSIGYEYGLHYFAMKLLHGETLAHAIKKAERGLRQPFELTEVIDLMVQACNGLEHAHSKSLLHRDIKPGNLMLSAGGSLTIMDFGIVKDLGGADSIGLKTAHGKIFGTPEYMPPEQAMGKGDYSPASDLYALAVVGYELLCGELPYTAETPIGIIIQHIRAQIPPLKGRAIGRYPLMESIFQKALAKDPRARYESAHELRVALIGVQQSIKKTQLSAIDPHPHHDMSVDQSSVGEVISQHHVSPPVTNQPDLKDIRQYPERASSVPHTEQAQGQPPGSPHPPSPPPIPPKVHSSEHSLSGLIPPPKPTKRDTQPVSLQRASKRPGHYKRPMLKRKK